MLPSSNKIAIIGAGSVGGAIVNSLLLRKVAATIILVDIDPEICHAQVQDLSDAEYLSNVRVKQGHHQDAGQCDIIVISSGAKQRPGDTRLDLIGRNIKMLKQVFEAMQPIRTDAILVLVANPVDILTHFAQQLSGLPKSQVFGSGTFLDTVRLRGILAKRFKVADTAVHAYVLGEHGDSQFIAWSSASVGGTPLLSALPLDADERAEIATVTKTKAYNIIAAKGFTSYGVAAVVSSICESIIFDQGQVYPLSHWQEDLQCCLSLPAVLGRAGIVSTITPALNEEERAAIVESAKVMRQVISEWSPHGLPLPPA